MESVRLLWRKAMWNLGKNLERMRFFAKDDDGTAAVEFALLAMPFFFMLMGTIETALAFSSGVALEGGAAAAARMVRTGQVQLSADPEETFKDALCANVGIMIDCNNIQYEVINMANNTFASAADLDPVFDDDGNLVSSGFSTGNSKDIVMIRAAYRYEFVTPVFGSMSSGDMRKNNMLHMATVVIKAEPYTFGEE